ncbi:MAG: methylcobalamin:coenzyme M methyltransferase [Syntrophorhabdus sp. PtaU1.Bin050]|nr:MAG: methylcobalamin:coenzyme M methyltransferase [Syntrophorhabdus sp. PtaU1.Bin050]
MEPNDRVVKALTRESTDRPPFICPGEMMSMMTVEAMQKLSADWPNCHRDAGEMSRLALGVQALTGIENLGVPYCTTVETEAMGAGVNIGTTESEPRISAYPLNKPGEWESLPRLTEGSGRLGSVAEAINILHAHEQPHPIIANLTGPVSLATSLDGTHAFLQSHGQRTWSGA